ncbi:Ig-like domain-containing protein [candidate division KSB1 bacterium]|nr:Ig-like domain-containing protein [candidate division KSB1 bacterium]
MKANMTSPKILTLLTLILFSVVPSFAAADDFERGNGALGSNWAANTNMVILDGRLHNAGTAEGWDSYLAVYFLESANEVTLTWPAEGDGLSGVGAQLGGIAFVNSFSAAANGYLVYIYGKEVRLFELANGSPTGSNIQPDITASVNPGAGDDFTVKFNTSTYTFTLFVNGTQVGSIKDTTKRVAFASRYAGVMLYKSNANQNDVEAFEAAYVPPVSDTTPPAKITTLAAGSPTSTSITLTWTAVGDDGNSGTAASYDIRRSKNNILSESDFANATKVAGPSPKTAGASETFAVSGLEAATKYFFAIKAIDEASNAGIMSSSASATTLEGGGGGGGDVGQLLWKTDDFERADLGATWAATNYMISSGELTLLNKINGWNNIALYQSPGAYGAGMVFSPSNSQLLNGAYIPAGLLILMDNANPSSANGYLIKRGAGSIDVYRVTSGAVASNAISNKATTLTAPQPGDKVEAVITNNGSSKTVRYYVRGQLDATLDIADASSMDNMHAGVSLYGGSGFYNNLSSFSAGFLGGSGAQKIVVHSGNNQTGPIQTQLPSPIEVYVSDDNDEPSGGTLLDFQLIQGKATFDDIANFQFLGQVWVETEEGRLLQPNARVADDGAASGGKYVTYDWITGQTRRKAVAVPFYVPEASRYDLWVRSRTNFNDRYRFYYSLDRSLDSTYCEIPRTNIGAWVWVRVGSNVPVTVGMHDLNLIPYHADLQWDKILIQKVGSASDPSGVGGTGPVFPNMTDADGIGSTRVSFGTDADTSVIVYVYAYQSDGSRVEEPAVFTLDPTPGPAVTMTRDPGIPEPLPATPGFDSPSMKVLIRDQFQNGVEGTTVNWKITQGEGDLAATTLSDENGIASNVLSLNFYQETDYKVQASVSGLSGSPVTFTIQPGKPPKKIVRIQPKTLQQGNVNTTVDSLLIVRILKGDNSPFENYPVDFTVTQGNGTITRQNMDDNASALEIGTDMEGYARAVWTLGGPGLNVVEARAENLEGTPVRFEATAQTGQPADFYIVSGDNQDGNAGLPLVQPFIAKVADSNGYPVSEQQVDFEIVSGQGAYFEQTGITQKTAYTGPTGEAKVTLTMGGVLNEEHVVKATAFNTGLPVIYFHATPTKRIAKTLKYMSGNGSVGIYQSAVVTNKLAQSFVVKAEDPYGYPAVNQAVTFKVMNGGGNFDGATEVTKNTDDQGQAKVTLTLGTLAGDSVHIVHAVANRIDIPGQPLVGSPIVFKATGLPKSASRLVKVDSTDAQTGEVGLPLSLPIQVKVTDEYFNPIKNHTVTYTVRNSGGDLEDSAGKNTTKVVKTGTGGVAAVIWNMPNTPGIVYTDVTANKTTGGPLENSPMEFSANARQGAPYQMIRKSADSVYVGTVWRPLQEKLKIQITDRLGNPLMGVPVKFEVKTGGGLVNGLPQVVIATADTGYATVTWQLGKKSGIAVNSVQATASVSVNPAITFKATGTPDVAFRLVADSSYTTYGTVGAFLPDPVKVQIVDQHGNGVAKQYVDFDIVAVGTNIGYLNIVGNTAAKDTTDNNGYAEVRWGLGPQVGSQNNKMRATAQVNQVHLVNSPYVFSASAMVGGAEKLYKVTNDTNLSSIIGNTLSEYLKVRVTDGLDNPVANVAVRFQVLSRNEAQGGTLDGLIDSVKTKNTDSNGFAWVQFTLGHNSGYRINKVEARAENPTTKLPLSGSPVLFEITGTSTNARKIALVDGGNQKGVVGEYLPRPVQVKAMDQYNNPVRNQPIRYRIVQDVSQTEGIGSLGPGAAVDTSVNTNAQGVAVIQWRLGHTVGKYTLEASSFGNGHLENSPMTIVASGKADRTSPDISGVVINPKELVVSNGEIKATVIVTLRDAFANPVSGKAVNISVTGEGNLITQPADTTNAAGQAIGYLASRIAGLKHVSARDMNNGIALRDSAAQILFKAANAAAMTKAPGDNGDTQKRNVGTVLENPLKVLVTDRFGNPIKNVAVTFRTVTGGGSLVDNQPVFTDSLGVGAAKYRLGSQAGANLIEASSTGLSGSPVNFSAIAENPQQISRLEILSGNHLVASPGQELPEPLRVRVLDVRSWPVFGKRTKFDVLVNDAVITSENPLQSDMYGDVQARVRVGTANGLNIIKAYLEDLPNISATFYDTTRVQSGSGASAIQNYAGNNQTGSVGQTLAVPLTVRIVDPYSNPVPDVTVKFEVIEDPSVVEGAGTLEGGVKAMSRQTNALGLTQVYYTLGQKSGLNKIRVSIPTLDQVFTEFEVYGSSSTAHQMRKWAGDNQTGEMGRFLLKPVSVMVTDLYGNPARGGRVNFVVISGGGSFQEPQPILSDANGIAQVHWKIGPRPNAYVNQVQCVAELPGGTFIETFTATGDPAYWPRLQLPNEYWIKENEIISFNVSASGSDNPPILCTPERMPDSTAVFVDNGNGTWTFSWRPDYNVVQSPATRKEIYAAFRATDTRGGMDIDSVRIVVQNKNRPPQITNYWPKVNLIRIEPGTVSQQQFGLDAYDADGDVLTVTWYVNRSPVGYGQTWTMDMSQYPPYNYYDVDARVVDSAGDGVSNTWGLKVPVELASFTSAVEPYKGVILEWETAREYGNSGFNVLRSLKEEGDYVKVNEKIIPSSQNGRYEYVDSDIAAGRTYYYKLENISVDGSKALFGPVTAEAPVPKEFRLAQNYPNPFNPATTIRFDVPNVAQVTLQIYNVLGQHVRTLVNEQMEPGYHVIMWDSKNDQGMRVSSGVYYYQISAGDFRDVKKMALVK